LQHFPLIATNTGPGAFARVKWRGLETSAVDPFHRRLLFDNFTALKTGFQQFPAPCMTLLNALSGPEWLQISHIGGISVMALNSQSGAAGMKDGAEGTK
jgi:hypothetical protein